MARPILSASTVVFFAYTGQFMAYPIIPFYVIRELNGTPFDIGLVLFVNLILAAAFSVPMGALSDRWGRKKVIFMGAVIATIGYALLPFTESTFQLMIVFGLAGLGHAAYGAGTVAYVSDIVTKKDAARGFGWTQISRNMSISVGPAIGGFLAAIFGLASAFFVCALFLLIGALVTLVLIPSKIPVKLDGGDPKQKGSSQKTGMINVLKDYVIIALLMSTFGYAFAILAYRGFIPLFAEGMQGTPIFGLALPAYIGVLFSVQAGASILARIPLARYSDKSGRRAPFVMIGLLLTALTIFLIANTTDVNLLIAWSALLGFASSMGPAAGAVILMERTGQKSRGATFGLNISSLYAGQAVGSLAMGGLVQVYGFQTGFLSVAALLIGFSTIFLIIAIKMKLR